MNVIPIVLRSTPEVIVPVVVKGLKNKQNPQISNDIVLFTKEINANLKYGSSSNFINSIIIDTDCEVPICPHKFISVCHDVIIDSEIKPVVVAEALLSANDMIMDSDISNAHVVRYRKISEIDNFTLAELDNMKLEDIDYIET